MSFASVEDAIADIAAGKAVVVVDDADRENEGDIIFAAAKATPELLTFTIRYTSGVICVPMEGADLDRLQIPLMTSQNRERMRTAYTVSVDARDGVTTGHLRGRPRAGRSVALCDSATEPYELVRPGHIFPLRYHEGGVLQAARAHRGGGRPGPARRADPGRGARRGRQRRRHDGAAAAAGGVRQGARPQADLHRAARGVPQAHRAHGRAGRRDPASPTGTACGARSATPAPSTAASTSRSSSASSATARTSWSGRIRSA